MALVFLLALVRVLSVSVKTDVLMLENVQRREADLQPYMIPPQHEIEQRNVEQSWVDMLGLLFTLVEYWRIWFYVGLILLLFWNMVQSLKMNQRDEGSKEEEEEEVEEVEEVKQVKKEEYEEQVEKKEQEVQEELLEEQEQVELVEQQQQEEQVEQEVQVEQEEEEDEEEEEEEEEEDYHLSKFTEFITRCALEYAQGRATRCHLVEKLMNDLLNTFRFFWSDTFFPVLQTAIGVGSAFEGWSHQELDTVYRLIVPIEAPQGHSFLLELGDEGDVLARNSRIRVELQCMCPIQQQLEDVLCFLHHQEDELSQNQEPSLLQTLCTDSYLDVQKTVTWFTVQVDAVWKATRRAQAYDLKVLPSSRSCNLQLTETSSGEKILVELLFGVQQGNSDIFLTSQNTEGGFTPSTAWPQSCAVAEKKFFQHTARNALHDSTHLSCLTFLACASVQMGFSTYVIKTIVLHLLALIPLKKWSRTNFVSQLLDLLRYLEYCVKEKCLTHFLVGNGNLHNTVVLPEAFQSATPLNLFQHLKEDPAAYFRAQRDFRKLKDRFLRLLIFRH
ncbi:inositol 1,4,5-trisphosphate receptor-interacting protein-like 1 [Excalfactoria chinensis]|uniref:inositol 1,4,5-trisphosphate receptor-interacting protein-like 1 n=1 Tax=Excalfactoria chinensis TaxID=46218 RepID=UPI003B3A2692